MLWKISQNYIAFFDFSGLGNEELAMIQNGKVAGDSKFSGNQEEFGGREGWTIARIKGEQEDKEKVGRSSGLGFPSFVKKGSCLVGKCVKTMEET